MKAERQKAEDEKQKAEYEKQKAELDAKNPFNKSTHVDPEKEKDIEDYLEMIGKGALKATVTTGKVIGWTLAFTIAFLVTPARAYVERILF